MTDKATVNGTTGERPVTKPTLNAATADRPVTKPAVNGATADRPRTDKPVDKPTADGATAGRPVTEEPVSKPAVGKPSADRQGADKPVADKPAAVKTAADQTAAVKPARSTRRRVPRPVAKPAVGKGAASSDSGDGADEPELPTVPRPGTPEEARPEEDSPLAPAATAQPARTAEVDRLTTIWQARKPILVGTVVVALLVYLISSIVPSVYSSSATVSVTAASTPGGSAEDVALASNDLAAQDAQLVQTDSVLDAAAKTLGVPASTLAGHLSAGTVAAQNLIQITVQASSAEKAQRSSQAVAVAFQRSLVQRAQVSAFALQASVNTQSASLSQQIANLQQSIAANQGAAPGTLQLAEVESQENQLTNLMESRATLTANTAIAVASEQPDVNVVVSGTPATKVSPRPFFYALIAGLLALLVGCQLAVVARRRSSRGVPE